MRSRRPNIVSKRPKDVKKFALHYTWRRAAFNHRAEIEDSDEHEDLIQTDSALDYFLKFFSEDLFAHIVDETNMYSVQETGKSIQLTIEELRDFLSIHILMGIVEMPSYLDYWSKSFRYAPIADLMSLNTYCIFGNVPCRELPFSKKLK